MSNPNESYTGQEGDAAGYDPNGYGYYGYYDEATYAEYYNEDGTLKEGVDPSTIPQPAGGAPAGGEYYTNEDAAAAGGDPNAQGYYEYYGADGNQQMYDPNTGYYYDYNDPNNPTQPGQNPMVNEFYPNEEQQQQLAAGQQGEYAAPPPQQGSQQQASTTGGQGEGEADDEKEEITKSTEEKFEDVSAALSYVRPIDMWISETVTNVALSKGFKIYMCYNLWVVFVLTLFYGYNLLYATTYRLFVPPDDSKDSFIQSMAYFVLFFSMSLMLVTLLCTIMDMIKDYWNGEFEDTRMWGMGIVDDAPPWVLYLILLNLMTLLPLMWALILTLAKGRSNLFFFQFFFYISTLITWFIVIIIFFWFHILALREKARSYSRRHLGPVDGPPDDDPENSKKNWFHFELILEEYGLDSKSIIWTMVVFLVGLLPVFIIMIVLATEGRSSSGWNAGWTAIAVVMVSAMMLIREGTKSKFKSRTALVIIGLLACFFVFALIGCGASGNGILFGVLIVSCLFSGGFLLRKRTHQLTNLEIMVYYGLSDDEIKLYIEEHPEEVDKEPILDTYVCVCRNSLLSCFSCFDIKRACGWTHPDIKDEERLLRKRRICARTDQRVLFWFWIGFSFLLLMILLFGRIFYQDFGDSMASRGATIEPALNMSNIACNAQFNSGAKSVGGAPLTMYDVSLLAALSYSYGTSFDKDFSTWFSHVPSFARVYPVRFTGSIGEFIEADQWVHWTDIKDTKTNFHVVLIRSMYRGPKWLRTIDIWGESLTIQAASILAPSVVAWPKGQKQEIVKGMAFLKDWYGGNNYTDGLEAYIAALTKNGHEVLLVGHGFNGAIAKIVGARLQLPVVAFNSPGTTYLKNRLNIPDNRIRSIEVRTEDITNYIDNVGSDSTVYHIPCTEGEEKIHDCYRIEHTVQTLEESCGDVYGRTLR